MASPWERYGPSWDEARDEYISALKHKEKRYQKGVVEKYVDQFMNEEYIKGSIDPVGSDRGFWMNFDIDIEEIEKLMSK